MSDELQVVDVEALKAEQAAYPMDDEAIIAAALKDDGTVHLTDRQVKEMMERSIARSHCSAIGLAHIFPALRRTI